VGQHYTYTYFDENQVPYYVGEGSRRRFLDKHRVPPPAHVTKIFFNTKEEAQAEEMRLIALYGRKDLGLGTLLNLTDGGPGTKNPWSGHRQAMREAGRKAVESGRLATVAASGGRVSGPKTGPLLGRKNVESGQIQALGRRNVESGHLDRIRSFEAQSRGGRKRGPILARENVASGFASALGRRNAESGVLDKARHTRWHVNRGISSPSCSLCNP
jgi:hypothetical protein